MDKVQAVIIRLRKREDAADSKNSLIAMLEDLLQKEVAEKKKKLSDKYGIVMTVETEGRIHAMCNYSERILEQGEANGIIRTGMKYGISKENILADLQETLKISLQRAQEYLQEFGMKTV